MTTVPLAVRYNFTQRFSVSAKEAFKWCTDFQQNDHVLMGEEGAQRQIIPLTDCTLILKDLFRSAAGMVEKQKLVQLYPDQLFWTSTHLTGPNKHSQFLYAISAEDKEASVLDFTGLHMDYEAKEDVRLLAKKLRKEDKDAWKLLARNMARELRC